MSQVNKERVEAFCAALEAMDESQHIKRSLTDDKGRYCALGVGVKVALDSGLKIGSPWDGPWTRSDLDPKIQHWYGFSSTNPSVVFPDDLDPGSGSHDSRPEAFTIMNANDSFGLSYWRIAQLIRATYLKDEDA